MNEYILGGLIYGIGSWYVSENILIRMSYVFLCFTILYITTIFEEKK